MINLSVKPKAALAVFVVTIFSIRRIFGYNPLIKVKNIEFNK